MPGKKSTKKAEQRLSAFFIHIQRAAEVAIVGNFTMSIGAPLMFLNAKKEYDSIIKPALKGLVKLVKAKEADLLLEMNMIENPLESRVFESFKDYTKQQGAFSKGKGFNNYTSCEQLLKSAANRCNLSTSDCDKVLEIAKAIACLDNSTYIEVQHVAEAIHYKVAFIAEQYQDLEGELTYNFGPGITIATHELEQADISAAIQYLRTLVL